MSIHRYHFNVAEDVWQEIRLHAEQRGMSARAWLVNASRSQLNRENRYTEAQMKRHRVISKTWPSGWPRARACFLTDCAKQEAHDPYDHTSVSLSEVVAMIKAVG